MASENVYTWIEAHRKYVKGNVLEIGSKRYSEHSFLDLREFSQARPKTKTFLGRRWNKGEPVQGHLYLFERVSSPQGTGEF